ncbi:MAG: hypothetical protein IPK17_37405 [Chloroflexi bacterium]|nr:hypothetical protein [Chloroflexota bacterium]
MRSRSTTITTGACSCSPADQVAADAPRRAAWSAFDALRSLLALYLGYGYIAPLTALQGIKALLPSPSSAIAGRDFPAAAVLDAAAPGALLPTDRRIRGAQVR